MGNTRSLKIEAMPQLSKPKPQRKGASEEHIFAEMQRAKMTAALVAGVKHSDAERSIQRALRRIAGSAQV